VLNAVLVHFLGDVSEDAGHFANERQKVVLHKRNPQTTGLLDQTLNLARNRNGHSEAIEDVLRRNRGSGYESKPFSYEKFQLDKRVLIGDADPSKGYSAGWKEFDEFKALLGIYAPGYSKDGRTSVVVGFCRPSTHATAVVYYLKNEGGDWIVKWRAFVWYV
jgi:hypothetical protein